MLHKQTYLHSRVHQSRRSKWSGPRPSCGGRRSRCPDAGVGVGGRGAGSRVDTVAGHGTAELVVGVGAGTCCHDGGAGVGRRGLGVLLRGRGWRWLRVLQLRGVAGVLLRRVVRVVVLGRGAGVGRGQVREGGVGQGRGGRGLGHPGLWRGLIGRVVGCLWLRLRPGWLRRLWRLRFRGSRDTDAAVVVVPVSRGRVRGRVARVVVG